MARTVACKLLRRRHLFGLLILVWAVAAGTFARGQAPDTAVPLVLKGLGQATLPLDGAWQFHPGDDRGWASPSLDDSAWEPIQVGRPWEGQGHYGLTGFAWYRRHLAIAPNTPDDLALAVFLPDVDSACEVYWNGVLVGSVGKVPPHPVWYFRYFYNQISGHVSALGHAQPGVLAIRVWKAPSVFASSPDEGGLIGVPRIGSTQAIAELGIAARYDLLKSNQFPMAVALLLGVVGLLALFAWLLDRERIVMLWLAIVMFFPAEMFFLFNVPGVPFRWAYGLVAPAVAINDVALWFLLLAFLGLNDHRRLVLWTRIFAVCEVGFDVADGCLQLIDWSRGPKHLLLASDIGLTILPVLLEFWGVVIVLFALRKRLDAARWMLVIAGLLAELLQAVDDMTSLGVRWTHWTFQQRLSAPLFTIADSPLNARTVCNMLLLISILYVAWRYSVEQSRRQSVLEGEYHSAQELQQVLIPEALSALACYTVHSAYRPAQEVGGDFFQLIALPDDALLLVIGDVSGKGLPAAMAVALIVGAIRSTAEATDDPAAILTALNRRLHGRLRGGFATCLALRLDAQGNGLIANAGHLSPFLGGEEVVMPPALPLGLLAEAEYEAIPLQIAAGSCLTLYTDGLLEARNSAGELFGFERTRAISGQSAEKIATAAQEFGQDDDITVLTLSFVPPGVA